MVAKTSYIFILIRDKHGNACKAGADYQEGIKTGARGTPGRILL